MKNGYEGHTGSVHVSDRVVRTLTISLLRAKMMLATTKTHLCVSCHQWPARYLRHLQHLRPHKDHFFIAGRTRPYSRHIYEAEDARQRGPSDIRLIWSFNKTSFCDRNWGFPFVVSSRSCSCKVYLMVLIVMRNRSCGTLVPGLKNTFRSPRHRSRPGLLVPYTTGQCVWFYEQFCFQSIYNGTVTVVTDLLTPWERPLMKTHTE